jgi:hypothetical protein
VNSHKSEGGSYGIRVHGQCLRIPGYSRIAKTLPVVLRGLEIPVKIFLSDFSVFDVQVGLSFCRTSYRVLFVRLGSM